MQTNSPDERGRFRAYTQVLEAEFASPEDARAATLAFRALPPGMEMSVSSRWDDSNPRHLPNARAVVAAGAKATYYLNAVEPGFIEETVRPILALGCSVGAHTKTHPFLTELNTNGIFDEILGNRIAVESATDACVTAFTLPFGDYDQRSSPDARSAIGESLRRAGILGGGDALENPAATYGLPADSFVGCLHFGFDDRHPSRDLFEERIGGAEERFRTGDLPACGPHVAMGTHSWADDEGMAEITRCFETRTRNPAAPYAGRTWFCNENEFIAAWMQARHARVLATERDGATVRWTIRRPEPAPLGADVPLFVQFGSRPAALCCDGAAVPVSEDGQAALPHAADHRLPARIGHIPTPDKPNAFGESAKFPGLRARLDVDPETGRVTLRLRNDSLQLMRRIRVAVRVPLAFADTPDGAESAFFEEHANPLLPEDTLVAQGVWTRLHRDAWHGEGPMLFDAEIDFEYDGIPKLYDADRDVEHGIAGRLHVTRSLFVPHTPEPGTLRDAARIAVALPAILWTPEKLANLSRPGATLEGLRLFPVDAPPAYAPNAFDFRLSAPEPAALAAAVPVETRRGRLNVLVAEFTASGREAMLERRGYGDLFLNGELREPGRETRIPTRPGVNRVVIALPLDFWCPHGSLAVFEDGQSVQVAWTPASPSGFSPSPPPSPPSLDHEVAPCNRPCTPPTNPRRP